MHKPFHVTLVKAVQFNYLTKVSLLLEYLFKRVVKI